jgi:uncharacterized membrane protein
MPFAAEQNLLLGIVIGIASYCCLYIGKGIQKLAINRMQAKKSIKKTESGIWIFGTVLTVVPMFVQWIALLFAPVNVIAPLEGVGLVVLVVFSYFALKEDISKQEISGIFCIIAGIFLTSFFAGPAKAATMAGFKPMYFIWIASCLIIIELILILMSKKTGYKFAGVVFGFTAGTMMAFQSISKRISTISEALLPGIILTCIFAILTLLITQIGFTRAKASQVVSSFTSASILVASVASIFILSESMNGLQFLGIAAVVMGVLFITILRPGAQQKDK